MRRRFQRSRRRSTRRSAMSRAERIFQLVCPACGLELELAGGLLAPELRRYLEMLEGVPGVHIGGLTCPECGAELREKAKGP